MKKIFASVLGLLGLLTVATTEAQRYVDDPRVPFYYDFTENQGWYGSALGGANFLNGEKYRPLFSFSDEKVKLHTKTGYIVGGAIGYKFCTSTCFSYRLEGEVTYCRNNLKKFQVDSRHFNLKGFTSLTSYMLNGYLEWNPNFCFPFAPYVGLGLGYGNTGGMKRIIFEGEKHHSEKGNTNGVVYQWIVGISYPICNKLDLGLEYRYVAAYAHMRQNIVCVNLRKFF